MQMRREVNNSEFGFSLIELMIALTVGLVVIGAAVQLFSRSVNAEWVVSQKSEMQQDMRAASNMLTQDISLAGAGLGNAAIALPSGTGTLPVYGCDQTFTCNYINGAAISFPVPSGSTVPYLYGVIPGPGLGPILNTTEGPSDIISLVYTDSVLALNCYTVPNPTPAPPGPGLTATTAVFTLPNPLPSTCTLPTGLTQPQSLVDPVVGLTPGDLIWFTNTVGGSTGMAVAEVTSVANNGGGKFTVTFAAGDPMRMNQTTATAGNLAKIDTGTNTVGTRIYVITYFINVLADPLGTGTGTPRLMRMVNGHTPVPVAENVAYTKFSYNLYNGTVVNTYADGGLSEGLTPNMASSINLLHLTIRSQLASAAGYQGLDLQTAISARNLTFTNRY
jgi:prepilin-type N-terminal cleavage/methylation domain-containing protein